MHLCEYKRLKSTIFEKSRDWLWYLISVFLVQSSLPGSSWRLFFLSLFGANVGAGIVIKPGVRVKRPWRLTIGSCSWIGEDAWIDNVDDVHIGSNTCISQSVYICAGSHDWTAYDFKYRKSNIFIGDFVWLAARSIVAPSAKINEGVVLTIGSCAMGELDEWSIYSGSPALKTNDRIPSDHIT